MNVELEKHLLKIGFYSTEVFVKLRFISEKCHDFQTTEVNEQNGLFVIFSLEKKLWENIINRFSSCINKSEKRTLSKDFLSLLSVTWKYEKQSLNPKKKKTFSKNNSDVNAPYVS